MERCVLLLMNLTFCFGLWRRFPSSQWGQKTIYFGKQIDQAFFFTGNYWSHYTNQWIKYFFKCCWASVWFQRSGIAMLWNLLGLYSLNLMKAVKLTKWSFCLLSDRLLMTDTSFKCWSIYSQIYFCICKQT